MQYFTGTYIFSFRVAPADQFVAFEESKCKEIIPIGKQAFLEKSSS